MGDLYYIIVKTEIEDLYYVIFIVKTKMEDLYYIIVKTEI